MLSRHVERQASAAPRPRPAREELVLGEDYWEEDQQENSYNPAVAAAGRPVLRRLAGETPSARKEFRRQLGWGGWWGTGRSPCGVLD